MTRIILEGVSKVYAGSVRAVTDFHLEVHSGELLALMGPSGCGKTTLLRLLAGLERPSAGVIRFDERQVDSMPPHTRNVAMVFQDEALQPHLNVWKNLAFGLQLRRRWHSTNRQPITDGELNQRINQAVAALGIEHLLARLPRQLSGGERQRVALGQALVRSPDVLLLDEPLSHLDTRLRGELRALIKELHNQLRTTTIYVTHDHVEALALGERIAVMQAGKLEQVGAPLQIYDRPVNRAVAELLGTPAMNFIPGRLEQDQEKLRFVGGGLSVEWFETQTAPLDANIGRHVVLGVRPEHVRVQRVTVPAGEASSNRVDSLANITMVETLGDSTILRLRLKNTNDTNTPHDQQQVAEIALQVKLAERWTAPTTGEVSVDIDPQHCHLFDSRSGQRRQISTRQ